MAGSYTPHLTPPHLHSYPYSQLMSPHPISPRIAPCSVKALCQTPAQFPLSLMVLWRIWFMFLQMEQVALHIPGLFTHVFSQPKIENLGAYSICSEDVHFLPVISLLAM